MMYVNNDDFYAALIERKRVMQEWKDGGSVEPKPRVNEFIGKCIYDICTHLYFKPGFINLNLYRDEMISDAMENCIRYVDNFDPQKSTHPFAYFTQIAYYAYLRRIGKERRYFMTKQKVMLENPEQMLALQSQDEGEGYDNDYSNWVRAAQQITDYDKALEIKPKKPKVVPKTPLELMMKGDE